MENRTWDKDVGLSDAIGHLTLKFLSIVLGLFLGFALASLRRERLEKHAKIQSSTISSCMDRRHQKRNCKLCVKGSAVAEQPPELCQSPAIGLAASGPVCGLSALVIFLIL